MIGKCVRLFGYEQEQQQQESRSLGDQMVELGALKYNMVLTNMMVYAVPFFMTHSKMVAVVSLSAGSNI